MYEVRVVCNEQCLQDIATGPAPRQATDPGSSRGSKTHQTTCRPRLVETACVCRLLSSTHAPRPACFDRNGMADEDQMQSPARQGPPRPCLPTQVTPTRSQMAQNSDQQDTKACWLAGLLELRWFRFVQQATGHSLMKVEQGMQISPPEISAIPSPVFLLSSPALFLTVM